MNIGGLLDFPWAAVIDSSEKLAKIIAIVVGGVWAYYRFFRGRTFKPRLEVGLTGIQCSLGQRAYLYGSGRLRNVGLSRVAIDSSVTALRVFSHVQGDTLESVDAAEWVRDVTLPAFQKHQWIEPGELVEDSWLIALPKGDAMAFRLELRVAGVTTSWSAESIVLPPSPVLSLQSITNPSRQA